MHVILDSTDNSVTLSPKMCQELQIEKNTSFIFIFKIKGEKRFGLKRVSTEFAKTTQCGIVSLNPKLKTFGFITNCPTVSLIFYEMGITGKTARLKVKKEMLPGGDYIYGLWK
ncbi:hypothetical protein [uncultured Bacteroides sp.]|uniref:hypothetical protein n=1 Tax=uncultured Bacteroides sp. TaxID=162156 RepID=UPI002AA5EE80|nr:hypothetical protein [uncultured Bacteroides sp.]